jgi:hypothetical protein
LVTLQLSEFKGLTLKNDEPPRILFNIGQKGICNAYVFAGGIKMEVPKEFKEEMLLLVFLLLCLGFGVPEAVSTARIPPSVHQ